ncbi:MAG: hypothetical protein FWE45_03340 [Firmicutes bacterium]|nr:hypothetical protein [Bacillota bacterium]
MFCTKCGHNINDDKFCSTCGFGVGQDNNVDTQDNFNAAFVASTSTATAAQQSTTETSQPATKAVIGLILGFLAMTVPVPILDIILGVVGIILAVTSDKRIGGLRTAALVVAIIGTVIAIFYTITVFATGEWTIFGFIEID